MFTYRRKEMRDLPYIADPYKMPNKNINDH